MAQWKPVRYEKKTINNNHGDGINTGVPPFDIKDSEATYMRNIGSQYYPAMATRPGRTFYSTAMTTLTTPNCVAERNNSQLHVVDGNTWKYWNTATTSFTNLTTALTSTDAEIMDFATGTARYTLLMNSTQLKYWDGTSSALNLGDASTPKTKIFIVHKGRVYAASGATVYYSALNLINDWTTASDAGQVTIARAKGDITGLCEYNDKVIAFTETGMHELYGDGPSNFQLVDVEGEVGCYSNRSIIKCNKRLYWYWNNGIYEYNGGSPVKISSAVDDYIKAIAYANRSKVAAGSNGEILYIAIPYTSSSNDLILVFDTKIRKWYIETGNYTDFVFLQNKLYGLDSTGGVMDMRSTSLTDNGTEITWSYVSKPYTENAVSQKKVLDDLSAIYKSTASSFTIGYSTSVADNNSTSFITLANSSDMTLTGVETNTLFQVPTTDLQDESWYRLKYSGTGSAVIYRTERNYLVNRR